MVNEKHSLCLVDKIPYKNFKKIKQLRHTVSKLKFIFFSFDFIILINLLKMLGRVLKQLEDQRLNFLLAFFIRIVFLFYGQYHDEVCNTKSNCVRYTDVDYKVFTDASRYVYEVLFETHS